MAIYLHCPDCGDRVAVAEDETITEAVADHEEVCR